MSRQGSFTPAVDALRAQIRAAGEARGFAVTRLLTHWAEIVGEGTAAIARPIGVTWGRGGGQGGARGGARRGANPEGATLTLLALGAAALRLEMEAPRIRERVNACYGYAAVARIRIQQTGPAGFAEPQARLKAPPDPPDAALLRRAETQAAGVGNTELRLALAALAANVLSKSRP